MTRVPLPSFRATLQRARHEADGALLVEVMVSALILIGALTAAVLLFNNAEASAGDTRLRAVAASVGERDQAFMQTLSATEIQARAGVARTTRVDGQPFTVRTRVTPIDPPVASLGCDRGTAGYLSVETTVDWPTRDRYKTNGRRPVVLAGNVTRPSVGRPGTGEALLYVRDARGKGVAGLPVRLLGGVTLQRNTDVDGCVLFRDVPAASRTFAFSDGGKVDPQNVKDVRVSVTVAAGRLAARDTRFDVAGAIDTQRFTKVKRDGDRTYRFIPSNDNEAVRLTNSGRVGNVRAGAKYAAGLFPFATPYRITTDMCSDQSELSDPEVLAADNPLGTVGQILIKPGQITQANLFEPAIDVQAVWNGRAQGGAKVVVTGKGQSCVGERFTRFTAAGGYAPKPGFPVGTYDVCVEKLIDANTKDAVPARWYSNQVRNLDHHRTNGQSLRVDLSVESETEPCR